MQKHIVFIYKSDLLEIPLICSICKICIAVEHQVVIICGYCNSVTKQELLDIGINTIALNYKLPNSNNKIAKLAHWIKFRSFVKSTIRNFQKNCIFWLGSGDTAIALYRIKLKSPFILHLHELYDKNILYRLFLRKISKNAKAIVCPEQCRAAILQVWFKLKEVPFVLPNVVYSHPRKASLIKKSNLITQVQTLIDGRKVLLYQGHIGTDRSLFEFADAINTISDKWVLIVMGKAHDQTLDRLRANYPHLIYISHINPPNHLDITALATIGIITYTPSSLNNIFCAPNKIWEYAGYGIPFISNKLPTLQNISCKYKCGICINQTKKDILIALKEIESNYIDYSDAATRLFDSVDIKEIVNQILNKC